MKHLADSLLRGAADRKEMQLATRLLPDPVKAFKKPRKGIFTLVKLGESTYSNNARAITQPTRNTSEIRIPCTEKYWNDRHAKSGEIVKAREIAINIVPLSESRVI